MDTLVEAGRAEVVSTAGSFADDDVLAARLASAAGRMLLAVRERAVLAGGELGDAGDATAQVLLRRALAHHRPDDAVLSEEAADDRSRLDRERVWIVDPLDGTREYAEGRDDWAVHVGLVIAGRPSASAVALPALGVTLTSSDAPSRPSRGDRPLRIAVSRSRAPEVADRVARAIGAELVPLGSAGFKAMAVVRGEVDAYLHAGGQYEWDSAAPAGVALAAGLHASRIDGSELVYNRPDTRLPDLLIADPAVAPRILELIAEEAT